MTSTFLVYGANGFVGEAAARMAVETGLRPVLAGRDAAKIEKLAAELGLECRVFDLQDPNKVESALKDMTVLLHCAGPYLYTSQPMVSIPDGNVRKNAVENVRFFAHTLSAGIL